MIRVSILTLATTLLLSGASVAQDHAYPAVDGHHNARHHDAGHGSGSNVSQGGLSDLEAIRAMQKAMFDTPDDPLDMGPVVISGDYAVSDWPRTAWVVERFCARPQKGWGIFLCAGAGLKDAAELEKIGVPTDVTTDLASQLAEAETSLSAEQIALIDSFDGTMMVDASLITED